MKTTKYLFPAIILASIACNTPDTIYQWRGNGRNGIFPETGLLKEWPEGGPSELWYIEDIGNGNGSPTFAGDRFYISGEKESRALLQCYTKGREKVWETDLGSDWVKSYRGSRSAPTIAGDLLYYVTGTGNIYCVGINDGKIKWSKEFDKDAEGMPALHGMTEAPVIDGDKVFWNPGGKKINVAALNRFTGELIWSSEGLGERSAYNQGNLVVLENRNIYVTYSAYHLMGFDSSTGELLWSHEQDNLSPEQRTFGMGDTHSNSVIFSDGALFYAAGDGNCGVRLELSPDGKEIKEAWRNKSFDGYMGGIIKSGNYIYGGGTARPKLFSISAETGNLVDSLSLGSGAIVGADNMLYYYSQKGDLNLVKYTDGKLQKISSFRITRGNREHFAHPVIYKGVLYQRHGNTLIAYNIKAPGN